MKIKREKLLPIFFGGAVAFFIIFIAFAFWWSASQSSASNPSAPQNSFVPNPSGNEANGWSIYTSAAYGFSMQYPDSFGAPSQAFSTSQVVMGTSGVSVQQLHELNGSFDDSTLGNKTGICLIPRGSGAMPAFFYFKDAETIGGAAAYHYINYPDINQRFCTDGAPCFYYDIYRIVYQNHCYEIVYERQGSPVAIPADIQRMITSMAFVAP